MSDDGDGLRLDINPWVSPAWLERKRAAFSFKPPPAGYFEPDPDAPRITYRERFRYRVTAEDLLPLTPRRETSSDRLGAATLAAIVKAGLRPRTVRGTRGHGIAAPGGRRWRPSRPRPAIAAAPPWRAARWQGTA